MLLKDYRVSLKNALLDLAWSQWITLGVAGHAKEYTACVIDIEALILFTTFIGQYDQRLFDSMQDWLQKNGRFVNIQRLTNLQKNNEFKKKDILAYIAGNLVSFESKIKWEKLAQNQKNGTDTRQLFRDSSVINGQATDQTALQYGFIRNPYKYSGKQNSFYTRNPAALQLKLRGFFGVNSRAEVMLQLLSHDYCKNQEIAQGSGFSWRSIQDILFEMTFSGVVSATESRKSRLYRLTEIDHWKKLLGFPSVYAIKFPRWCNIFFSLEKIYYALENPKLDLVSELSVKGIVEQTFQHIGTNLLECGIHHLQDISSNNYLDIPNRIDAMIMQVWNQIK